jgi:hypothetical protein
MTTYDWVAATQLAALADNANVTSANVGSVSGLGTLAIVLGGGGTATKDAGNAALRFKHNTSGAARIELPLVTASNTVSVLIKMTLPTANPSADSRIVEFMDSQGTPANKLRINHKTTTGQFDLFNAAGTAVFNTTPDHSGTIYVAIGEEVAATSPTTSNGKMRLNVYDSTYTLVGSTTYSNDAQNTIGSLASALKTFRIGRINTITDTSEILIHYIRISDSQITPLSPISAPPTIVLNTPAGPYYEYNVTSSTPGGGGVITYSIAWTSGPNNIAGVREPVDGWFFIPQGTAVSQYTITADESGNTDTEVVDVPAISAGTPSGGVRRRKWDGFTLA